MVYAVSSPTLGRRNGLNAYYERRFDEAIGLFSAVTRANQDDKAAHLYRQRCAEFITRPPPEDREGVEQQLTK